MIQAPGVEGAKVPPALKMPVDEVTIVQGGKEEEEVKEITESMFDVTANNTTQRVAKAQKKAPKPKTN